MRLTRLKTWKFMVTAYRKFLALLVIVIGISCPVGAIEPKRNLDSRRILHLYDSRDRPFVHSNAHEMAQLIFDHLGLVLIPHDIRKGLPKHSEMLGYRGIFTWFTDWEMPKPTEYLKWLKAECEQGRYLVVWGHLGAYVDADNKSVDETALRELYKLWGFESDGNVIAESFALRKHHVTRRMFNFERPLRVGITDFVRCRPIDPKKVDVYLSVREAGRDIPHAVVARHPHGGFALEDFVFYAEPRTYRKSWLINPFEYLRDCYRLENMPAVDLTTLNGCRMFYAHIDGDGSLNLNHVKTKTISGEIIFDEVLKKYDVPTTVGVVEGEAMMSARVEWVKSRKYVEDLLRAMLKLDNVRPGSHGCTHPMHWQKGVTGIAIKGISRKAKNEEEKKLMADLQYPDTAVFLQDEEEWLKREILGSIDYVNRRLAPPGKICDLFQWTGNCRPSLLGLKTVQDNNLLNINAGDPRFDEMWPSYTSVLPAYLYWDGYVQYYTSGANEIIYTSTWTRNFAGIRHAIETFKRTGYPRRIKPVNIYYHFYSGERPCSLKGLQQLYEYSLSLELAMLYTNDFVKVLRNSLTIALERQGNGWKWRNAKECRTLRCDRSELYPDFDQSKGVIGYYMDPKLDCMYLHLDGRGEGHVVFTKAKPTAIHLSRANGYVNDWQQDISGLQFTFAGHGKTWIELRGCLPLATYEVQLGDTSRPMTASPSGMLKIELPKKPFNKNVKIKVRHNVE